MKRPILFGVQVLVGLLCLSACGGAVKSGRVPAGDEDEFAGLDGCEAALTEEDWKVVKEELIESGVATDDQSASTLVLYAKSGSTLATYDHAAGKERLNLISLALKNGWLFGMSEKAVYWITAEKRIAEDVSTPEDAIKILEREAAVDRTGAQLIADEMILGLLRTLRSATSAAEMRVNSAKALSELKDLSGEAFIPLRDWITRQLLERDLGEIGAELKRFWGGRNRLDKMKDWFRGRKQPRDILSWGEWDLLRPTKGKTARQILGESSLNENFAKYLKYMTISRAELEYFLSSRLMELDYSQLSSLLTKGEALIKTSRVISKAKTRLAQLAALKEMLERENTLRDILTAVETVELPPFSVSSYDAGIEEVGKDRARAYLRENFAMFGDNFWDWLGMLGHDSYRHRFLSILPPDLKGSADVQISRARSRFFYRKDLKDTLELLEVVEGLLRQIDRVVPKLEKIIEQGRSDLALLEKVQKQQGSREEATTQHLMDYGEAVESLHELSEELERASTSYDSSASWAFGTYRVAQRLTEAAALEGFQRIFPPLGTRLEFESFRHLAAQAARVIARYSKTLGSQACERLLQILREHARNLNLSVQEQELVKLFVKNELRSLRVDVFNKVAHRAWAARNKESPSELDRLAKFVGNNIEVFTGIAENLRKSRIAIESYQREQKAKAHYCEIEIRRHSTPQ